MSVYDEGGQIDRTKLSSLIGMKISGVEVASGHAIFKDATGATRFEVDLGHLFDEDGNYFEDN